MKRRYWFLLFMAAGISVAVMLPGCLLARDHVYLTWQGDTSTTMTVNLQTDKSVSEAVVYYDTEPHQGRLQEYPRKASGTARQIPGLKDRRWIHRIELTGLTPGARYYFAPAYGRRGGGKEYRFRTTPNDGSPIRFVAGGDIGILPRAPRLLRQAASQNPLFIVIGGDIAYANGKLGNVWIWDIWFYNWARCMVTPEGDMIPIVAAIGNHEVNDKTGTPEERAPFYHAFFAQNGGTYFTKTFGPDMVLFVLDSGHIVPQDGPQSAWLDQQMSQYDAFQYKLASYHVPLYPSNRSFENGVSAAQRTHWLPIFDAHGLDIGLEHHDHTFKRTKALRNNQIDPHGAVYLGDGCMGVPYREIENAGAWYLESASGTPHFWTIDVTHDALTCRAVDVHGRVFDEYVRSAE